MAQQTIVHLVDDLDGGEADETVIFGLDGTEYEIDLTAQHADELRECLRDYVVSGRRRSAASRARSNGHASARSTRRADIPQVRAWAQENGYQVSNRGRVPYAVFEAYDASN